MQSMDLYSDGKVPLEVIRETLNPVKLKSRLSALVATDQDCMVSYGEIVLAAVNMIDIIAGVDNNAIKKPCTEEVEWLKGFEIVSTCQTHHTMHPYKRM
ncbi:uncharacterized protein PHALS_14717 [Plasmopara halstedii]|uniref:Uncharacterized protein n=1 Tax=Plasmopara halstedii TaxID=4781 RepID=A0A0P1A528_PLAHL|nr:uncharacterized protein PHALS_14717 [Plasmopara halstedii]CEG35080.1 hypothetical protein PHALS_14717 [Plasmopara halstedii]|eukprot:XP_024571449.1 hypothetical protein PHALS_14717 [Plasmopara halstedii]